MSSLQKGKGGQGAWFVVERGKVCDIYQSREKKERMSRRKKKERSWIVVNTIPGRGWRIQFFIGRNDWRQGMGKEFKGCPYFTGKRKNFLLMGRMDPAGRMEEKVMTVPRRGVGFF